MRAAVSYQFGGWGSNDCPLGSARIVDSTACKSAAASKGKPWYGNNSGYDYPEGCYNYEYYYSKGDYVEDSIYFNDYEPNLNLSSSARPLCLTGAPISGTAIS